MQLSYLLGTPVLLGALCLYAQAPAPAVGEAKGVPPRAAPTDYQTQAQAGTVTIAAEFMGHAVPTPDAVYNTEDYVVVETAFFGAADSKIRLSAEDFTLRIGGKKGALSTVPSELVLRTLKDPNWIPDVPVEAKSKTSLGGSGNSQGDPPPSPPKMPMELQHVMRQRVQRAALLSGDRALPQAGLLFFQYHGKPENIRSLELVYSGPAGPATLKLQP